MKGVATFAAAIVVLALLAWVWHAQTLPDETPDVPERRTPTAAGTADAGGRSDSSPGRSLDSWPLSDDGPGGAFNCSFYDFQPERDGDKSDAELMEEDRERLYELTDMLAASADLEHRLTATLMKTSDEMPDAIEELESLLPAMPEHPVLHWRLLDACDARPGYPFCESGEAEARVIATLGANGEAWAKIAHYRIKRGDDAGGLEALLNAHAAAEFQNFWGRESELFFRGLSAFSNRPVPERLRESTGLATTMPAPELKLVDQCMLRASGSPEWQRACRAYGERKEADASTVIGKSIGLSLQDAMSTAAGQEPDPAKQQARDRQVLALFRDDVANDGLVLLASDQNIALAVLQRIANDGEFAAHEFLRSEVLRLREVPGYDPCPPKLPQM